MTCAEAEPLLGAALDGELDARTACEIERHLAECGPCSGAYGHLAALHEEIAAAGLDWSAETDLRPLRAAVRRKNRGGWWQAVWSNHPALVAVSAAALLFLVFLPGRLGFRNNDIERQVVDNHVRSLMADHLIDVPSSDRHTVKPWFQGKLGFSPVVPDLTSQGFVLAGGRLDVIAAQPAAAIVYKRQNHVINLWMAPAGPTDQRPVLNDFDGYHVVHWQHGGMACWAVSDLNSQELLQFAGLIRAQ